ncbi:uncharacterized protein LOC126908444 isoform X5 [Daktulosphaira vitifoliae]|uniref:uncharacterized protein LOC126908444 isoform X5 n=1 Tax=Daktulosphaira vitifoliae TaxID=58002 RepID=UPI0021A9C8F4|nr:uncharacterized protein LOC126908444 isoform X5 [Daktulosphaira vitifoliae]
MFSIKLLEICVILLYAVLFMEVQNNNNMSCSNRKAAIINSICQYNGWQHLTDIKGVKYRKIYYTLNDINKIVNRFKINKKVRASVLILSCAYSNDLKNIFVMINHYCSICQDTFDKKYNTHECTTEILSIIKKITLLATVMKESLIALDALYGMPSNETTYDYMLYYYLSHLQKVENNIVHNPTSQTELSNDLIILSKIKCVFNEENRKIESEIFNASKECKFKRNKSDSILQKFKRFTDQNPQNEKKIQYLNKNINDEIKKIVIEKFYNLGFYFNIDTQMIDVRVPDEVNNNKKMEKRKSNLPHFIEIEKNKTATGIAEIVEFLLQALTSNENNDNRKFI